VPHCGRKGADDVLLAALAGGKTATEAAFAAGVSLKTAQRRIANPAFAARLAAAKDSLLRDALDRLRGSLVRSVQTLEILLGSEAEVIRLRSAVAMLEQFGKLHDRQSIETRLAAIEARLAQAGQPTHYDPGTGE
jgi:hypothetical protein